MKVVGRQGTQRWMCSCFAPVQNAFAASPQGRAFIPKESGVLRVLKRQMSGVLTCEIKPGTARPEVDGLIFLCRLLNEAGPIRPIRPFVPFVPFVPSVLLVNGIVVLQAPIPRCGGLIMEETRSKAKEPGTFWSFRNMLEMNNLQSVFLERCRACGAGLRTPTGAFENQDLRLGLGLRSRVVLTLETRAEKNIHNIAHVLFGRDAFAGLRREYHNAPKMRGQLLE